MAGAARRAADRRMVHRIGRPRRRAGVAVAALHRPARNVRRRGQAGRRAAVVTRRAAARDAGVIERHASRETHRILVAGLAGLNSGWMICWLS